MAVASPPAEVISRATVVTVESLVFGLGALSVSLEGSVMDFAATTTGGWCISKGVLSRVGYMYIVVCIIVETGCELMDGYSPA